MESIMGSITVPHKVMLFTGLLYNNSVKQNFIFKVLEEIFGDIIHTSKQFIFTETDYYDKEMGAELGRVYIAFDKLIEIEEIADTKIKTNDIEKSIFTHNGKRDVNIDPGYLTGAKVVLVTTKNFQHRIYLRKGIYAEVTLCYKKGTFTPWEWTYKDYRREESIDFFNRVRNLYKTKLRLSNV